MRIRILESGKLLHVERLREIAGLKCFQSSLSKTDTFGTNITVRLIGSQIEGVKKGRVRKKT